MKRLFTQILLVVFTSVFSYAAKIKEKIVLQNDIEKINGIIAERFSKTDCYEKKEYLYINMLNVNYAGDCFDRQQICEDIPLLRNVTSIFIGKGKKKYLQNITLICDQKGNMVAYITEYGNVVCVSHYQKTVFDSFQRLAYMSLEKGIDKLFGLGPMSIHQYLGVDKNNTVYYINDREKTITPLDEMTDEEWKNALCHEDGLL